jgi:hypothetical protein
LKKKKEKNFFFFFFFFFNFFYLLISRGIERVESQSDCARDCFGAPRKGELGTAAERSKVTKRKKKKKKKKKKVKPIHS